jgi:hypothetical protein
VADPTGVVPSRSGRLSACGNPDAGDGWRNEKCALVLEVIAELRLAALMLCGLAGTLVSFSV